ncbi:MAG: glycosyltransferase family 4 protein [Planctomycetes bacterium]|nr:glycosyltransferase family 4 protein [Planctomycetota bacterium]
MHVGYVLKKFPRLSETFILDEILGQQRLGARVTVFSIHRPDDGRFHARLAELAGPVVYLPQRKSHESIEALADRLDLVRASREGLWSEFEALLAARRRDVWSVLEAGLDVAARARALGVGHLHAHFATIAADVARVASTVARVPYSFTAHAKDIYQDGVDADRFARLARGAEFVVTVCDANREHIATTLAPDSAEKVVRLYNGIDLATFSPSIRRPDATPLVLGIGRLVEKKGFDDLIRAVAALRRQGVTLACAIVGDGEERAALQSLAAEIDAGVEFTGALTHDATRGLLARATLLAQPCVIGADGNRDALPTVLLEALGCGVPVVTTPIVGIDEITGGSEAGVLVPPRDPHALAAAIRELLADPARRASLVQAGRARAERLFDLRRNSATLNGLYLRSTSLAEATP